MNGQDAAVVRRVTVVGLLVLTALVLAVAKFAAGMLEHDGLSLLIALLVLASFAAALLPVRVRS